MSTFSTGKYSFFVKTLLLKRDVLAVRVARVHFTQLTYAEWKCSLLPASQPSSQRSRPCLEWADSMEQRLEWKGERESHRVRGNLDLGPCPCLDPGLCFCPCRECCDPGLCPCRGPGPGPYRDFCHDGNRGDVCGCYLWCDCVHGCDGAHPLFYLRAKPEFDRVRLERLGGGV